MTSAMYGRCNGLRFVNIVWPTYNFRFKNYFKKGVFSVKKQPIKKYGLSLFVRYFNSYVLLVGANLLQLLQEFKKYF